MCRHPSHQNTMNIINIYSQFQETLSVEIQLLDWMRRVMQKFIMLSVLISACLSRAFRHSYFRSCKCQTRDSSKNYPFMPVHVLPDYNRQLMNEKVRRVLCLWSISCLRASVFNPSSCYKIFSLIVFGLCPFSFDIVSCMLCWVEPTLLFKQKIIEAEKGFKQKKLRNAIGLTLVSSYYGIQYCWKCLKETLQKKKNQDSQLIAEENQFAH